MNNIKNLFNEDINIGEYYLKNYVNLTFDEKKLVLFYRNLNKKWMLQQDEITLESHLKWIENLKNDNSKLNYLVYKNNSQITQCKFHYL